MCNDDLVLDVCEARAAAAAATTTSLMYSHSPHADADMQSDPCWYEPNHQRQHTDRIGSDGYVRHGM